jgi:ATP-dependent exoDNAse (exonuclease V) alpha subunit
MLGGRWSSLGDSGQLPSVAAGEWFAAVAQALGGPQLRQVMRQRDPTEREALEALHDCDPEPYLAMARKTGRLSIDERENDALDRLLADWNEARRAVGLSEAVMIARDNVSRALLNDQARRILVQEGAIAGDGVTIVDHEFAVGGRVIARRNDRYRGVDNSTLGQVAAIDRRTGAMTIVTHSGEQRQLDGAYATTHLEHAYAVTGHGAHGAAVEWAGLSADHPSSPANGPAPPFRAHARVRTGT